MTANFTTMPMMFSDCNRKYFNQSLPIPKFGLFNKLTELARFEFNKNKPKKGDKKKSLPIKWQAILFTDCYDFDEETFRNIMVHEMIHYYIAINGIKDNNDHGKEFMKIAEEFNQKYNLNIRKIIDASSFKGTEKAPKRKGLMKFLFG